MEDSRIQPEQKGFRALKQHLLILLSSLPPFGRAVFVLSFFVFLVASFVLLAKLNDRYLVLVPRHEGNLTEGIIGRPRFINPIIAKSDADRDMSQLIYSGLMKATPAGELVPDLAAHYEVSPDGLVYTFTLRDGLVWHDGTPITSADVAFTIEKVRDGALAIKSPRRASWEGVNVTTPDPKTVVFTIKQPYVQFLENATMGIIPKHIWQHVPDEEFDVSYYNIEPIGSGPYRIERVVRDSDKGLPLYYDLLAFKRYPAGEPYITHLRIMFFGNSKELSQSYRDHTIDQMHTVAPALAQEIEKNGGHIERAPLPRVFGVYFNQGQQPILADKAVRKALATAIDKKQIVDEVLLGYGRTVDGPLPDVNTPENLTESNEAASTTAERIAKARAILEGDGWVLNTANIYQKLDKNKKKVALLELSISLPDVGELKQAAKLVKNDWEKIGALVTLKVFDPSSFTSDILSTRKYDVIFYGQVTGRNPDPFPYWHSSQRNAPGLNITLYANKNVDKLLEAARKEQDEAARALLLQKFSDTIKEDIPAVFIYSPDFLYATGSNVQGMHTGLITTESERFLDINDWYVESERVWKWFADRTGHVN